MFGLKVLVWSRVLEEVCSVFFVFCCSLFSESMMARLVNWLLRWVKWFSCLVMCLCMDLVILMC